MSRKITVEGSQMTEVKILRDILNLAMDLHRINRESCLQNEAERIIAIALDRLALLDPENTVGIMVEFD